MSATRVDEPVQGTARPTFKERFEESRTYERLRNAGEMSELGVRAFRLALTPPFDWLRPAVIENSKIMRRCLIPVAISVAAFSFGYGFFTLGGIMKILGATDREGGAFVIGFLREVSIWVTGMVFAGVAGSAITSDLGARKVREELDALSVLGVDRVRSLVVPRVLACTFGAPVLGFLSYLMCELVNFALAPSQFDISHAVIWNSSKASLLPSDIYAATIKYFLIGVFVGVVACQKGLSVKGGTAGVGRAVNETVVLTFAGVWILNAMFNLAYLSLFPDIVSFKG